MALLEKQVRHDSASLFEFVNAISARCEQKSQAAAYLPASEQFVKYILALANKTKSHIQEGPAKASSENDLIEFRRDIAALRAGWRWLHTFIKPALDADTLNLPTALVGGVVRRLREIPKYSQTDFVIYHTDAFNYLQVRLTKFRSMADKIANLVQGKSFPEKLGLIGIPYSQSSSLFINCLIPHEMGHFVFGDNDLHAKFSKLFERDLLKASLPEASRYGDILAKWAEELFCDLFAIRLTGPCYSFAYLELFDLCKVLDEKGQLAPDWREAFSDFYPPDLFRVREHVRLLKLDRWWSELGQIDSHYIQCLKTVANLKDSEFHYSNAEPEAVILQVFFKKLQAIYREVNRLTHGIRPAFRDWKDHYSDIAACLENGVVPSSIRVRRSNIPYRPNPISLINAAYRFYIESLDKLLLQIENAKPENIEVRSKWASRIQEWTAKAIEDFTFEEGIRERHVGNLQIRHKSSAKVAHKQSKKPRHNATLR